MLWISEYKRDLLKSIYNTEWTKLDRDGPNIRKWIEWMKLDWSELNYLNKTDVEGVGPNWTVIDRIRRNRNEVNRMDRIVQNGLNWTEVDKDGPKWKERTEWDWIGRNKTKLTELDWMGPKWIELDRVGLHRYNGPSETELDCGGSN